MKQPKDGEVDPLDQKLAQNAASGATERLMSQLDMAASEADQIAKGEEWIIVFSDGEMEKVELTHFKAQGQFIIFYDVDGLRGAAHHNFINQIIRADQFRERSEEDE